MWSAYWNRTHTDLPVCRGDLLRQMPIVTVKISKQIILFVGFFQSYTVSMHYYMLFKAIYLTVELRLVRGAAELSNSSVSIQYNTHLQVTRMTINSCIDSVPVSPVVLVLVCSLVWGMTLR